MQTIIQVFCSKGPSLRDSIVNDKRLSDFDLAVREKLRQGRTQGWAKISSRRRDRLGALNLQWDSDTRILLCRVVNRRKGRPDLVLGDFVSYLLRRYRRRIAVINILAPH
jgi:hypothetical protein